MVKQADIAFLTTSELSRLIKAKKVSPVEAVRAYLTRIEMLDPKLHAYITVCAEEAMSSAKKAERQIIGGNYRGPMHGIPFAVKDQWWTKGIRTTAGSTILKDFVPDKDAVVMTKMKEAGAILLGKTNMTEFAMAYTYVYPYGVPTNPWDLNRMPGGSSAGSASATSAFLCATSLGEDTAGSIRGPAAYCNIVGLRPSVGRVSRYGLLGSCWSMDTIGPMSRTIEDCAMTLQAIAGYDPKDPSTWKSVVPDYTKSLSEDVRSLRVGVISEHVYSDLADPEVRNAVIKAIDVIRGFGISIKDVSLPMVNNAAAISTPIFFVEGSANHRKYMKTQLQDYDPNMRLTLLAASLIPGQTYYKAQKLRELWREQIKRTMESVDVLISPSSREVAPPLVKKPGLGSRQEFRDGLRGWRAFTHPANLIGAPAVSVPCGFSKDGLPIGMQLLGRPMEEEVILRLGYVFEQATEWHERRPPI